MSVTTSSLRAIRPVLSLAPLAFLCGTAQAAFDAPPGSEAGELPRAVGTLEVNKPAFLFLESLGQGQSPSLLVSSFNLFGSDQVVIYPNIAASMRDLDTARSETFATVRWPNEAKMAPRAFLGRDAMVISGGFLVPGKATGAITVVTTDDKRATTISTDKQGYFYHRSYFLDMNSDGRIDVLTARANKPIFGASKGELLWLEQPANGALEGAWKEHVIAEGPDVHFRVADIDGDGAQEIIATQFFSKRLSLFWKEGDTWSSRMIDEKVGSAFDLDVVDLDADGKAELLVTNHEKGEDASVYAYEIPSDMRKGEFTRHTLLTGIETRQGGLNQASPGQAQTFFPDLNAKKGKPYILVSGDGSQRAHLLVPETQARGNWKYKELELVDTGSTVGQSAVGDVDGDGKVEIFVPAYDKNTIHVFSYGN